MIQGKILDFNHDMKSGFLRDNDDHRYHFFMGDCTNPEKLGLGAEVEFEHDGEKATQITVIESVKDSVAIEEQYSKKMSAKKSKKSISILLLLLLVVTIGVFVAIVVASERQKQKLEEVQKHYEVQIENIKKYLLNSDCMNAASEYHNAGNTRNEIYKYGAYYSIETHAQHGHAIDIAECFVYEKDFSNAVKMLDIKSANNVDYFNRASLVYTKAGDDESAQEAKNRAQEIIP